MMGAHLMDYEPISGHLMDRIICSLQSNTWVGIWSKEGTKWCWVGIKKAVRTGYEK